MHLTIHDPKQAVAPANVTVDRWSRFTDIHLDLIAELGAEAPEVIETTILIRAANGVGRYRVIGMGSEGTLLCQRINMEARPDDSDASSADPGHDDADLATPPLGVPPDPPPAPARFAQLHARLAATALSEQES